MKDSSKFKIHVRIMLFVFTAMFVGLIVYLAYSVISFGDKWYSTPYNPRIQNALQDNEPGYIYDRNGICIAWNEEGQRVYHNDYNTRLAMAHIIGDTHGMSVGAESVFAKYLYGTNKTAYDRFNTALSGEGNYGSDITLTVDSELCRYIFDEMDGKKGCVVVMNYKTGEILANVSNPTFDPNIVKEEVLHDSGLVDRAVMGRYPPGSLMKIVTAVKAVELGIDFEYVCKGTEIIGGQKVTCVSDHNDLTLESAFEKSCNCYFAKLYEKIGAQQLLDAANDFGFNKDFKFDDIILYASNFEISDEPGDNAWAAIGQHKDLITPMHAAMITGSIANDGVMITPKLLLKTSGFEFKPKAYTTVIDENIANTITEYMYGTVEEGTGTSAGVFGMRICGKTGTAEYFDEETSEVKNHSWFSGFIDDDSAPYTVTVIFEGAGYGSKYAAPMAGKVFKYLTD